MLDKVKGKVVDTIQTLGDRRPNYESAMKAYNLENSQSFSRNAPPKTDSYYNSKFVPESNESKILFFYF